MPPLPIRAISRHLKALKEAALIFNDRQGDFHRTFWNSALDKLAAYLGTRREASAKV